MTQRTEKMVEELLDRIIRIETRMCKLMEALQVPVESKPPRPAVFRYRNGVDISNEKC